MAYCWTPQSALLERGSHGAGGAGPPKIMVGAVSDSFTTEPWAPPAVIRRTVTCRGNWCRVRLAATAESREDPVSNDGLTGADAFVVELQAQPERGHLAAAVTPGSSGIWPGVRAVAADWRRLPSAG